MIAYFKLHVFNVPTYVPQTYLEAAKSQLIRGYKGLTKSKITSTVGQNVGAITHASVKLNFWDLGGQEELQSLWEKVGLVGITP